MSWTFFYDNNNDRYNPDYTNIVIRINCSTLALGTRTFHLITYVNTDYDVSRRL